MLVNKVAIVTGAARGIGLACAQAFAAEGCSGVMLVDKDRSALDATVHILKSEGRSVEGLECDVGVKGDVVNMVNRTVERFGKVDVLVANAGIVRSSEFLEMSEEDFDAVIRVNLKGVFLCGQAAAAQMVRQGGGGCIINMSSVNGVMAIPTIAGYNASKGGVDNLTRCMSLALARHNIRVNAIGPGSIATDVLQSVVSDAAAMARVMSRTPLQRIGEPNEIAQVAVFLASNMSSYITGQIIYADGGRMALNYTVPAEAK